MVAVGVDIGARNIKVVVLKDDVVIGRALKPAGYELAKTASKVVEMALSEADISRDEVEKLVATGAGYQAAPDQDGHLAEVECAALAATHLNPEVRTIIDVGAEEGRAIRCDENGKVIGFATNEDCAAGVGVFTEVVARALDVTLDELGPLSLKSTEVVSMKAQCVVFAESEMVAMIHNNVARADIARAVHDAIASRIVSMVHRAGFIRPVMLVGGVARNAGFVASLKRGLDIDTIHIPESPELCVALGAALGAEAG